MLRRLLLVAVALLPATVALAQGPGERWKREWPNTDFARASVDLDEILSGGPPKDGIPSIDDPQFVPAAGYGELGDRELVIGLEIDGDGRAYPLRVLMWHEIVNDVVGGVPVSVTYCPLCNAAIVFDRRVSAGGRDLLLEFGTTGKLRNSDLVMYDRQTESWWQQFLGRGIVGELDGVQLTALPARLEAWSRFRERHPDGQVLVPNNPAIRDYGRNPYVSYDQAPRPFLYAGPLPEGIAPMAYVVAVDGKAWSLELVRETGPIEDGDLVISWAAGANSALDARRVADGRDIGNVTVQRRAADGTLADAVYDLTFAFVFHAFHPDGRIRTE